MLVTIIEGGEMGCVIARIMHLLGHRINIISQGDNTELEELKELGITIVKGQGLDPDILTQPFIYESEVFISLMDTDLENLEACLYIKNCFKNKKTVTKVNNPSYTRKFEKLGIDIAVDAAAVMRELHTQQANVELKK